MSAAQIILMLGKNSNHDFTQIMAFQTLRDYIGGRLTRKTHTSGAFENGIPVETLCAHLNFKHHKQIHVFFDNYKHTLSSLLLSDSLVLGKLHFYARWAESRGIQFICPCVIHSFIMPRWAEPWRHTYRVCLLQMFCNAR